VSGQAAWFLLLAVTATIHGLLAGASLDQSIEQLPARHRIGVRAYLTFSRASHMANGRFWLIPLGIGGPVLSVVAAGWALALGLPAGRVLPVYLAAACGILNVLATARAGSINWTLAPWNPAGQSVVENEAALAGTFDRFERWQTMRAFVQFLNFALALWAVAANTAEVAPS
jgi:hypothetical protein